MILEHRLNYPFDGPGDNLEEKCQYDIRTPSDDPLVGPGDNLVEKGQHNIRIPSELSSCWAWGQPRRKRSA